MGLPYSKLLYKLDGEEILLKTLKAFEQAECIDLIIIACRDEDREIFANLAKDIHLKIEFVTGGESRQESVSLALKYLELSAACTADSLIAVHDAARCHISIDLIRRTVKAAAEKGAVTAALSCVDTVYRTDDSARLEKDLLHRSSLRIIQTPQVFLFELLSRAHKEIKIEASDDAGLVAQIAPVFCIEGDLQNKKITLPEDLC